MNQLQNIIEISKSFQISLKKFQRFIQPKKVTDFTLFQKVDCTALGKIVSSSLVKASGCIVLWGWSYGVLC
jgi:hypothetical protein